MDKFLETVMNFINENTTLLIIICVFLIFVLIGYLIDNSIKTKKLEKQMLNEENDKPDNNVEINNESIPEEKVEVPAIDPNTEINLDFRTQEEIDRDNNVVPEEQEVEVPAIDPNTEINLDFRTEEEKNAPEVTEIPDEPISNEVTVDPAINDLLLRDFANNGITTVDEEPEEVTINPIENVVPIDDIVNTEEEPIVPETPVEAPVEDSVYKNDKKLSDIFKKKTVVEETPNLEKTEDYSNELDKILKKLNEASDSKNSTLDETQDFSNMF